MSYKRSVACWYNIPVFTTICFLFGVKIHTWSNGTIENHDMKSWPSESPDNRAKEIDRELIRSDWICGFESIRFIDVYSSGYFGFDYTSCFFYFKKIMVRRERKSQPIKVNGFLFRWRPLLHKRWKVLTPWIHRDLQIFEMGKKHKSWRWCHIAKHL